MMKMGDYIRKLRQEKGLSQEQLGALLDPVVNRGAVNKWEKGRVENIKRTHIQQMAQIFGISPVELMCFDDVDLSSARPIHETKRVPVVGRVAAGIPILAEENIIDYISVSEETDTEDLFALVISGDSMAPRIMDGDIVIVERDVEVENGDIVIARINGENATCKRFRRHTDGVELIPLNPAYEPMFYTSRQVQTLPVVIVGKVVEARARF